MGLFSSLRLGNTALRAQQTGIEVTGHNLANVNTEGYTKQRADMSNLQGPNRAGPTTGRGVQVRQIERLVDEYLVTSIRSQGSTLSSLNRQNQIISQVESILNEFEDSDLSSALSQWFEAAQDFSNNPEDPGFRESFLQASEIASFTFNSVGDQLHGLMRDVNAEIDAAVNKVNVLATTVAELNGDIVEMEAGAPGYNGRNANDLRDQRDQALKELAEMVNINVHEQSDGSVVVSIVGDELVHGNKANLLTTTEEVVNGIEIKTPIFRDNLAPAILRSGDLHGLITGRDTLAGGTLADLNTLATGFMNEANRIQTQGYGLEGYSSVTTWEFPTATNVALNSAGFSRSVENGGFTIQVRNKVTGDVTPVEIQVDADGIGFDTTVSSLAAEIDAELAAAGFSSITTDIDENNGLTLTSSSENLTFSFTDDSSGVLNVLGWGTLFDGGDARGMSVSSLVRDNNSFLAAGKSTAPSDNSNALEFVMLRDSKVLSGGTETIEDNYRSLVTNLGTTAARLEDTAINQNSVVSALENERLNVSGVNTDEELINLMGYQRAYQSAARFINVVDSLLDTLINGLF